MTICIGRSSENSATLMLSQRWKTLSKSQDGYAILIQNQDGQVFLGTVIDQARFMFD
jgi:hypothetical protein